MRRLHCEIVGSGRPIVLVHGWGLHGGIWQGLAQSLSARARVLMPDLPGHGRSPTAIATTLDDWAHAVGACPDSQPAVWIGWSLGALVALRAATLIPASVSALVLIAATPRFVQATDWPHAMAAAQIAQFADELSRDYARTLMRFLSLQFGPTADERLILRALREQMNLAPPTDIGLREGLQLLERTDLRRHLGNIGVPTLIVHGERDRLVPLSAGQYLTEQLQTARLHVVSGAGHAPFLSHAIAVQREIGNFIDAEI